MEEVVETRPGLANRAKFIVGGVLILAAAVYLFVWSLRSPSQTGVQFFLTIDELNARGTTAVGQNVQVSGAVIGDTINYDPEALTLRFTIADVPGDFDEIEAQGGLAKVLHEAVIDPNRARLDVVFYGVPPDLLRDEAQAILTGQMGTDGLFHVAENGLLLKCPTKYEEAVPEQVEGN